jgi:outer membrane protein assembly factor BamD (BamD/ComL family)
VAPSEVTTISVEDLPHTSNAPPPLAASSVLPSTASELFAHANAARRTGNAAEALRLYQTIERQYPTSSEAAIAHVSAARLLEKSDVPACLVEYDAYLADARNLDLREEALGGRARALEKLGHASEERAAWQDLLTKYPESLQAAHARKRLDALR